MSKAKTIKELVNTLDLNPLYNCVNINDFYVDTVSARGADATARIEYVLKNGDALNKKFLFAGHSGSGKSTELYKLSEKIKDNYLVVYFSIADYVSFIDISFADIVFSMLKNLVDSVEKNHINVNEEFLNNIISYWKDESIITETNEEIRDMEANANIKASLFSFISTNIKALFQQSNSIKRETISRVEKTMSHFLKLINNFICDIKSKLKEKDLLIIVDDLDKLGENEAYDIFKNHSIILTSIEANIIYTFPVFMHYTQDYKYISMNFDESVILSMIMTKDIHGEEFKAGSNVLSSIIDKRTDPSLLEDACIKFAIEKSGGSIRNMLSLLRSASINAGLRLNSNMTSDGIVTMEDIKQSYRDYKNSMKRAINKKHLNLLKEVYEKKDTIGIDDEELVMDMFKTFAIIEYNCERWCDLNPAVLDYLIEIKEIQPK